MDANQLTLATTQGHRFVVAETKGKPSFETIPGADLVLGGDFVLKALMDRQKAVAVKTPAPSLRVAFVAASSAMFDSGQSLTFLPSLDYGPYHNESTHGSEPIDPEQNPANFHFIRNEVWINERHIKAVELNDNDGRGNRFSIYMRGGALLNDIPERGSMQAITAKLDKRAAAGEVLKHVSGRDYSDYGSIHTWLSLDDIRTVYLKKYSSGIDFYIGMQEAADMANGHPYTLSSSNFISMKPAPLTEERRAVEKPNEWVRDRWANKRMQENAAALRDRLLQLRPGIVEVGKGYMPLSRPQTQKP
jgi:hypothetical protein